MEEHASPTPIRDITGVVLAGGQGRRMGNQDKGLVLFDGRAMIAHVIEHLSPQVGALLINANRNLPRYAAFGYPLVADTFGGFAGPLAGLHAALSEARTPWIATAPCDSPMLPRDLVARLYAAAVQHGAQIAIARTDRHAHPVFALVRRETLPNLTAYLQSGERKVELWQSLLNKIEVPFDDQPGAFRNINSCEELRSAQQAQRASPP